MITSIPAALKERIDTIETGTGSDNQYKIAVFDLDNTLLEGDIGDALFAQLKNEERIERVTVSQDLIPFTWGEYEHLLKTEGKKVAYTRVITSMAGVPVKKIISTTRHILGMTEPFIIMKSENIKVPIPRPNPIMIALVSYLKTLHYDIYVVSASNEYSVKYTASHFFAINEANIFGMRPALTMDPQHGPVFQNTIDGPITISEGKVEAYHRYIGDKMPLITAGDSLTDFEILSLVDENGLCIWVGKDGEVFSNVSERLPHPQTAFFLKR